MKILSRYEKKVAIVNKKYLKSQLNYKNLGGMKIIKFKVKNENKK